MDVNKDIMSCKTFEEMKEVFLRGECKPDIISGKTKNGEIITICIKQNPYTIEHSIYQKNGYIEIKTVHSDGTVETEYEPYDKIPNLKG